MRPEDDGAEFREALVKVREHLDELGAIVRDLNDAIDSANDIHEEASWTPERHPDT